MTVTKGIYVPSQGSWQDGDKTFTAGDYQAVGLDGGEGVSLAQATASQAQLQETASKLQAHDFGSLTKHDLTGALMQTSVENYFVQTWAKSQVTSRSTGMVTYRMPSYGTISTDSPVSTFFGVPVKMTPSGVLTDMDRIASISVQKANNTQAWIAFNQSDGSADSRTESGVLEQQYSTPSQPLTGVSAVQALATADSQGQRICTINEANAGTAMAALSLSNTVMQDIADSVNAGLTVTTGQSSINYAGQTTAGYIILDPTTGAAAYKIASGADGSYCEVPIAVAILGVALGYIALLPWVLIIFAVVIAECILLIDEAMQMDQGIARTAFASLAWGIVDAAVVPVLGGSLPVVVISLIVTAVLSSIFG
jgi:hypothetical protein